MNAAGAAWIAVALAGCRAGVTHPLDDSTPATHGFAVHRTEHFAVRHDTTPAKAAWVAERLEAAYRAVWQFCRRFRLEVRPPAGPLEVILFARRDDYERFRTRAGPAFEDAVGFYSSKLNVAAFYDLHQHPEIRLIDEAIRRIELVPDGDSTGGDIGQEPTSAKTIDGLRAGRDAMVEEFNRLVLRHEAVHQVVHNAGVFGQDGCRPPWLVEGLACLLEVDQPDDAVLPNAYRLADFREAVHAESNEGDARVAHAPPTVPASLSVSLVELLHDFGAPQHNRAHLYAEAWAILYYLTRMRPDSLPGFIRALAVCPADAGATRAAESAAFEAAFGRPDGPWEAAWIAFMLDLPVEEPRQPPRLNLPPPQ